MKHAVCGGIAALLCIASSAAGAQELLGRWSTSGATASGGSYRNTYTFAPDQSLGAEIALAAEYGNPYGSGIIVCAGRYSFDGQTLSSSPMNCGPNIPAFPATYGRVVFISEDQVNIGGDVFIRQP